MKNMIFKIAGAALFFSAITNAATYADAAVNGKDSKLAKDFDGIIDTVKQRREKKRAEKETEVS